MEGVVEAQLEADAKIDAEMRRADHRAGATRATARGADAMRRRAARATRIERESKDARDERAAERELLRPERARSTEPPTDDENRRPRPGR